MRAGKRQPRREGKGAGVFLPSAISISGLTLSVATMRESKKSFCQTWTICCRPARPVSTKGNDTYRKRARERSHPALGPLTRACSGDSTTRRTHAARRQEEA
eukprot:6179076-Pleurochrysis_carterae.AAC.2